MIDSLTGEERSTVKEADAALDDAATSAFWFLCVHTAIIIAVFLFTEDRVHIGIATFYALYSAFTCKATHASCMVGKEKIKAALEKRALQDYYRCGGP